MLKYRFLLIIIIVFLCGCEKNQRLSDEQIAKTPLAQRTGLPEASGGYVLTVENEVLTSNEIVNPLLEDLRAVAQANTLERFKQEVRPELQKLVQGKISDMLLYKMAEKDLGENLTEALEQAVDGEIRALIVNFGGDAAKAEQSIKDMGLDWQSYRDEMRKMILTQSYLKKQMSKPRPVTYTELMDHYNQIKDEVYSSPATLQFSLIDIDPSKMEVTGPVNKTGEEMARELADELVRRLKAGEDFAELAKQYSQGFRASEGGLWKPVKPSSLAKPYDTIVEQCNKIEPGQFAGPIEVENRLFIVKLENKQSEKVEPFEKVQKELEARINFERQRKEYIKLQEKIVKQANIRNADSFVEFCLEDIYRKINGQSNVYSSAPNK